MQWRRKRIELYEHTAKYVFKANANISKRILMIFLKLPRKINKIHPFSNNITNECIGTRTVSGTLHILGLRLGLLHRQFHECGRMAPAKRREPVLSAQPLPEMRACHPPMGEHTHNKLAMPPRKMQCLPPANLNKIPTRRGGDWPVVHCRMALNLQEKPALGGGTAIFRIDGPPAGSCPH